MLYCIYISSEVWIKRWICFHISVKALKPDLEVSSSDVSLTPLVVCLIYF